MKQDLLISLVINYSENIEEEEKNCVKKHLMNIISSRSLVRLEQKIGQHKKTKNLILNIKIQNTIVGNLIYLLRSLDPTGQITKLLSVWQSNITSKARNGFSKLDPEGTSNDKE